METSTKEFKIFSCLIAVIFVFIRVIQLPCSGIWLGSQISTHMPTYERVTYVSSFLIAFLLFCMLSRRKNCMMTYTFIFPLCVSAHVCVLLSWHTCYNQESRKQIERPVHPFSPSGATIIPPPTHTYLPPLSPSEITVRVPSGEWADKRRVMPHSPVCD